MQTPATGTRDGDPPAGRHNRLVFCKQPSADSGTWQELVFMRNDFRHYDRKENLKVE